MPITGEDKKPINFVLKVYETKVLAEEGDENNALYVFSNGVSEAVNATIANGSQIVRGATTSGTGSPDGKTLVDSEARFGS